MTERQKRKIKDCCELLATGKCSNEYLTREDAYLILHDYANTLSEDFTKTIIDYFYSLAKRYEKAVVKYKAYSQENMQLKAKLELYKRGKR